MKAADARPRTGRLVVKRQPDPDPPASIVQRIEALLTSGARIAARRTAWRGHTTHHRAEALLHLLRDLLE